AVDRLANELCGCAIRICNLRLMTACHRGGRLKPAADRRGGEGVPPFALLPEVRSRGGDAVRLDRAEQELGRTARRGPELSIELLVSELPPRGFVREEDRAGLVELVP